MLADLSILIIDDMKFTRALVSQALNRAGYQHVQTASSGEEAWRLIEVQPFDVLIVDWEMPGITGIELTRMIRDKETRGSRYTAIILLTGNDRESALEQAFDLGADDFITKPFKSHELLARIHAAGRTARLQNSLLEHTSELQHMQLQQERLITRDPLTDLFNRRQLRLQLDAVMDQTQGRGGSACLTLIDIDGLGLINDTYGYDAGDSVIVEVANRLKHLFRPMDFVARHWGGVFSALLYSMDPDVEYEGILQRVLSGLGELPITVGEETLRISCSGGAQCYEQGVSPLSVSELELMALARLKEAQGIGRNTLVIRHKPIAGQPPLSVHEGGR